LIFTSFAALDAVRHIPIFVLLAMPVLAAALPATSTALGVGPWRSSTARTFFFAAVMALMAAFAVVKWTTLARNQQAREKEQFPQQAAAFLRNSDQSRRLFVYYDWGGYAIWKLYPHSRVFVDGRADLYGDDLLRQFQTALQLRTGWEAILDQWRVDAVLLPPSSGLAQALLFDRNWSVAFHDPHSVVITRTPSMAAKAGFSDISGSKGY
jgi:hypothetical protein